MMVCPVSCVLRPASCVLRPASCVLRPASCVLLTFLVPLVSLARPQTVPSAVVVHSGGAQR